MSATANDDESIVGDECHLLARSPDGPRGDPAISEKELDDYSNLILLCKVHHKLIDDQPSTYTAEILREIKRKHENWVRVALQRASAGKTNRGNQFITRIETGKEALSVVIGAEAFDFSYDEPESKDELELLRGFMQTLQDLGDMGDELEAGARVEVGFDLTQDIKNLEGHGFWVFGVRRRQTISFRDGPTDMSVAVVRVLRRTNPTIKRVNLNENVERSSPS
jgi:hypothetical protein